jgi:hypothetical protein
MSLRLILDGFDDLATGGRGADGNEALADFHETESVLGRKRDAFDDLQAALAANPKTGNAARLHEPERRAQQSEHGEEGETLL